MSKAPIAALVLSHACLLVVFDLAARPLATVAALTAAFAAWAWAARRLERGGSAMIFPVALILRALLLPLPPTLSDDLGRYVWDGRVVLAGFDPYRLSPEAEELAGLRDERWRRMPHREVATVYPPLALAVFAAGAASPWPETTLKIILTAADLLVVALLLRLAHRLGRPPGRVAWYAWCPLATLETAGMGHVDALGVAAAVGAVVLLTDRRPLAAGLAAAAAILAKLIPLVALPSWARRAGRPGLFLAGAATAALVLAPVAARGVPPGLVVYGVSWEHAGPLFEPLWRGLDRVDADDRVKAALDVAKTSTGRHETWNRLYPFVYPQLLAKLLLTAGFAVFVVVLLVRPAPDPVAEAGRLFGGLLLVGATVYPWYLLWVLPWAALGRHRAWLAAGALLPATYLPGLFGVPLFPFVFLAVWVPVGVLFVFSRWSTD